MGRGKDKDGIIDLMAEAARRGKPLRKRPAKSSSGATLGGIGNVVGDHNQVNIVVKNARLKPAQALVPIDPGGKHITSEQAGILYNMVSDVVANSGKRHQEVWSILKRRYRVAVYRELPLGDFADAALYLRKWLARL